MTRAQAILKRAHGTPEEFEAACKAAVADLMITWDECDAGVKKYRREWEEAGKRKPVKKK